MSPTHVNLAVQYTVTSDLAFLSLYRVSDKTVSFAVKIVLFAVEIDLDIVEIKLYAAFFVARMADELNLIGSLLNRDYGIRKSDTARAWHGCNSLPIILFNCRRAF